MRNMLRVLLVCVLAFLVALAAGIGSAGAQSSVVGPGESIQKAINAADPGDTIVVRGVHREDVIIRKNGIKLRGVGNAVIEAPPRAKADSPCSKAFGPEAICVLGDDNINTDELEGPRVSDVSVSGFTIRGFKIKGKGGNDAIVIDVYGARNATVVGNRLTGNVANGIAFVKSVNTTIAKNHVIGIPSPETDANGIFASDSRNNKIVNNVVRSYYFGIDVNNSTNTTIAGNDSIGNSVDGFGVVDSPGTKILSNVARRNEFLGVYVDDSPGTKILSNDVSRSGDTGIAMFGPERANNDAKVVGNRISGGPWGIFVEGAHGGSFAANTIHNNCAGMVFEALPSTPGGEFEVKGNTVVNNSRSCRAAQFGTNFSGIGIALLGARDMELTGNQISGNVPSGPTRFSGGVVVSTDPYGPGMTKPTNNAVTGNHFGRNKPDIFWDESGSGNSFFGNLCDTSVPSSLCN